MFAMCWLYFCYFVCYNFVVYFAMLPIAYRLSPIGPEPGPALGDYGKLQDTTAHGDASDCSSTSL